MPAAIVRAIVQQAAHALGAHVSKGDLLRADWLGHGRPMIAPIMADDSASNAGCYAQLCGSVKNAGSILP